MNTTTTTRKIGSNRGKARLWIEGMVLQAAGWTRGKRYNCSFNDGCIVYEAHEEGSRAVAGTDGRPIIDTNTDKIKESLKGAEVATITIIGNKIRITAAAIALMASLTFGFFPAHAMSVLVGCEYSGRVRDAFAERGHDAVSCDLLPTDQTGGTHIQDNLLNHLHREWDMVLAFPSCTHLAISSAWAFNDPNYEKYPDIGYHQRVKPGTLTGEARRKARQESIEFADKIYKSCDKVVMENPRGFLSTMWKKPTQVIDPHWFGDPHSKATCLWLKNLKPLKPTNQLDITKHGWLAPNGKWRWMNQTASGQNNLGPSKDRWKVRSTTYQGIANAFAEQYG